MAVRTALVSGSARGLGREIAGQLKDLDYDVISTSRVLADAQEAAQGARAIALDTTDSASNRAVFAGLARLDVLVVNAGITGVRHTNASNADLQDARAVMETNLFGSWQLAQAGLPLLRAGGHGRLVFLSSALSQLSTMGQESVAYRISKTALNALTVILAQDEAPHGVLVNAVNPGWVRTAMGGEDAPRSLAEGAAGVVWAATLPDDGPTGGLFLDGVRQPW